MSAEDDSGDVSAAAVARNASAMQARRVLVSVAAGVLAGSLRAEATGGLLVYAAAHAVFGAVQAALLPGPVRDYYASVPALLADGLLGGLLSFVLFWTLAFNLVHVF